MPVPLQIQDLVKHFGKTRAVDHVHLEIEAGELFFLLGPSGCGKTTLLRCIAGFHQPDEGKILLGSSDITRMAPHLRDTGMVFQSYALWPHMTVFQNVAFGLEMRKCSRSEIQKRVREALATVQLSDQAQKKPNQLSGGQQQRVALARALVIQPRVLLLDEPLSNLDAKLRLEMRAEIRRICKDAGLTAVYVTHDQKEALSVADRVALMNQGVVEQVGTPQELYQQPRSVFSAGFIGETNFLDARILSVERGRFTLATPIGEMESSSAVPEGTVLGDPVTLSIRPEAFRLDEVPEGMPNCYDAMVHDSIYLGETAQHQVLVGEDPGFNLKVFDLNPRIIAREGSAPARLWVERRDVIMLPPSGSASRPGSSQ